MSIEFELALALSQVYSERQSIYMRVMQKTCRETPWTVLYLVSVFALRVQLACDFNLISNFEYGVIEGPILSRSAWLLRTSPIRWDHI
jgi:hypothetical protein